jgi:hypothetical protein
MRFSCQAVRQRVSPELGGSDLELTPTSMVYMYSIMEIGRQMKLRTRVSKLQFGTHRDEPGTVANN